MPNPKRKHSKTRTATRRAQYLRSLGAPKVTECPNCGNPQQMHRACPNCGQYRGRKIVERTEEA